MTLVRLMDARGRGMPGREGFLYRLKDLVDRGRVEVADIRLTDVLHWVLTLGRDGARPSTSELCGLIEAAAHLALAKARRISGYIAEQQEAEPSIWLGPPPELPLRRSWLAERIAGGPWSFLAAPRTFEGDAPQLTPVDPEALRATMIAVLNRVRPTPLRPTQIHPRLSVESACALIEDHLAERDEVVLSELAGETRDRKVAVFLACLTLARQGRVSLIQNEPFSDIVIRPLDEAVDATA
jgi:hypothetical protein